MDYRFLLQPKNATASRQRLLYSSLRQAIVSGRFGPRHRLPGSRDMAQQLDIARNTVVYAYEQLGAEGYVLSTRRGTVVAQLPAVKSRRAAANHRPAELAARARGLARTRDFKRELQPFTPGVPALDAFPLAEWQSAVRRAYRDSRPRDLAYGAVEGNLALRTAVCAYLRAARGVRCTPDQVIITDGTQSALDGCARLLADERDIVWMENPGYGGARAAFKAAGLGIHAIDVDEEGMTIPAPKSAPVPKLIYVTPSHQYPLGSVLSLQRRLQLLAVARQCGAWILEDDYDSDFRYDGAPLAALQGLEEEAPVIYAGTFSKTLFPALRLGYMVVPGGLVAAMRLALTDLIRRGHQIEQSALADFIIEGRYTRHLSRMRKLYRQRQSLLREALAEHLPELQVLGVKAGLHLVLMLPAGIDDQAVCRQAQSHKLNPRPLSAYYAAGAGRKPGLVLGYGNTDAELMQGSIRMLARCIAKAGEA